MKKLYYLFLLLPLSFLFSCNDDKDLAPVDITLTLDGVTVVDGTFYTVAGEGVVIEDLGTESSKKTVLTNVFYNLNGRPILGSPGVLGSFSTEDLTPGTYSLNVSGNLLQVDASIQIFTVDYPFTVVSSEEDLPSGAPAIGTYSLTVKIK